MGHRHRGHVGADHDPHAFDAQPAPPSAQGDPADINQPRLCRCASDFGRQAFGGGRTGDARQTGRETKQDECGAHQPNLRAIHPTVYHYAEIGLARILERTAFGKAGSRATIQLPMSALGQKQTLGDALGMSALPPKADIVISRSNVRL